MMVPVDSRERAAVENRLRILELLQLALERRDEVFDIVESAEDTDDAQNRIQEAFGVQDPHISQAVLDMQVSRWTRAGRRRIADHVEELRRLLNGQPSPTASAPDASGAESPKPTTSSSGHDDVAAGEERLPLLGGPGLLLIEDFCAVTGLERAAVEALLRAGRLEGGVFDEAGGVVGLSDDVLPTSERLRSLGFTVSRDYAPDNLRSYEDRDIADDDDGTAGPSWTMSWQDDDEDKA